MDSLQKAREKIDAVDKEMACLFCKRMEAVKEVVNFKKENNLPVTDVSREKSVIEKNCEYIENDDYKEYYRDFISHTMAISRQFQQSVLKKDVVAYQGVEGAFSHIVLCKMFPHAQAQAHATWEDVFNAVENGSAAYGILPFENSQAGDVAEVLDLCFTHKCYVLDVVDLPVRQNLLCIEGATLSDIKEVYSHPQAISQCARFLKSLGISATPMENTAVAAKYVAESSDKCKAAIASEQTARLYGLSVLAPDINTSVKNTTRFIIIGLEPSEGGSRFSLLFTVPHVSGSLAKVIQEIAGMGYNLESIKSRPMPDAPFEYYFYVEIVGDLTDQKTKELKQNLSRICKSIRVLGSYDKKTVEG
ncbi:MAG: chorismate mutase [Clostridiales bacterium]|nr:MAG: chorismate mutase [Clostridiales bacterium]